MATLGLKNRSGTPVSDEIIDAFSGAVAGKVIRPADPEYDSARRIWNASIDKHPGLIVRCAGAADVVQAVKFGHANDLLVSIRGGGHNVAGRALSDDGLVIDLSSMKAVFVDPAKGTARVQGGATLGDLESPDDAGMAEFDPLRKWTCPFLSSATCWRLSTVAETFAPPNNQPCGSVAQDSADVQPVVYE